ncbi:hypothetical protein LTR78_006933 [Recurvomyces mirabilis]|uniref:Metallo-beta-lactamase domain-containing protein n=1 Tax=Recurvomyces mirabilis TaxID=574656 RepID=A0AAE0WJX9_9PEZI|nr:hypothetical protein LTR78_006933 [Recurvomyces mirabilis]KAK5153317.1 hypothetical protein LTS14_007486 [Recurvomyces mirabilis]
MTSKPAIAKLQSSDDFLLCNACGTQYPVNTQSNKDSCKICDDPRQFVPPEGQTFTTLATLRNQGHRNVWWQDKQNRKIWSVRTEPQIRSMKFAIGERAMLLQTEAGNILWDLIPFLDAETVDRINDFGGLKAIVISHPHYYSTWADWSRTFSCPVYVGAHDKEWLGQIHREGTELRFLIDIHTPLLHPESGVTAILAGGHFPGSLLLHWKQAKSLFIADTIFTSPSATNPVPGKEGVISFTFFWSIPNRIPLHPDDILMIWNKVKHLEFHSAYGAFKGMDVYTMSNEAGRGTGGVKGRLLQSCKIYVGAMGWREHSVFEEVLEMP